jgi:hypothetical protein
VFDFQRAGEKQLKLHADGKRWGLQSGIHLSQCDDWLGCRESGIEEDAKEWAVFATRGLPPISITLCVLRLITSSEEKR